MNFGIVQFDCVMTVFVHKNLSDAPERCSWLDILYFLIIQQNSRKNQCDNAQYLKFIDAFNSSIFELIVLTDFQL